MAAVDHDLLFGLLALQNGLIGQVQLVAAFQAWTLDRARPLAEHMEARGDLEPEQRRLVEAVVGMHLKKQGGDAQKSLAAIPAEPSTWKSLADIGDPEIEQTLTQLASGSDADADRTASYAVGTATSDGQRFRVLRPHAKGGLGAVFVALDQELHREVALKQILDSHADDPVSRARFLLEAEITGGLEHPGIVPVYGLGTTDAGRPYYAMRFIRGESLKEAIERFHSDEALKADPGRRSLELRKLLRRFNDVCNAIDYAHSRGILHRDIKPANVIVGRFGETLVVDWGLAKALGHSEPGSDVAEVTLRPSSASGSAETLPGSTLGTPAYMSPEQAEGRLDRLGPRSDVYSLGATLFCLLTGQAPFVGDKADVIPAVQRGDFRRPRQLNPTIDPALEAICLKAMACKPANRYGSPRGLAEDLERWMADEPVSAWREPLSRRARRWVRRNRTAMSTVTAALLAGVVGLMAVLAVQTKARADLARSLASETRANSELARSRAAVQARYELAVEAIKTFHTGVSEDFLLKEEQFKDLRDRLLKSASDFYGKLGALLGQETDTASRRALASANFEVAELAAKVGRPADALAMHRKVLAARQALAAEPGADDESHGDVGRSLNAIGRLLEATGKPSEAEAEYRAALAILQRLVVDQPAVAAFRDAVALSHKNLGLLLANTGRASEAEAEYRNALAIQQRLVDDNPVVSDFRNTLAMVHNNLGLLLASMGRSSEAEAEFRASLALKQKLAADNPTIASFRRSLANSHTHLGNVLSNTGRSFEAETEYRSAVAIGRKLVEDHPAVADFGSILGTSYDGLGLLLAETGRSSEAEVEYRSALAIEQKVADEYPTVTRFGANLAISHYNFGLLLADSGRSSEAEAQHRAALAILKKLADDNPTVTEFRDALARNHSTLGLLLMAAGRTTEAEAEHRAALAILQKLADDNPTVTGFRNGLAMSYNNLADLLTTTHRLAEAEAGFRNALAIWQKLHDEHPVVTSYRGNLAAAGVNLADVELALGHHVAARSEADRAVALLESLLEQEPRSSFYRGVLGGALVRRGQARRASGDSASAASDWRRMVVTFEAMPPRSSQMAFLEGCGHAMLADVAGRAGSGVSAAEGPIEAERAIGILRQAVRTGFRDPDAYRSESALAPLRERDDFRLLMMDLEMPAESFAPGR
jgi:eukaryotic-like serine/threonine-protein kinase